MLPTLGAPVQDRPIDLAVLISGSGSNLQALIDAQGDYRIVVVISDRPGVRGLERATEADIPTAVVAWAGNRSEHTSRICAAASGAGAEALVLAGFMRILAPEALAVFPGAILNVHPSLLPAYPGRDAVAQALADGARVTGVTVHFVDEQVDHGPIIEQATVEILPGDTVETLHARIQAQEHLLYPRIVAAFARGEISRPALGVEPR